MYKMIEPVTISFDRRCSRLLRVYFLLRVIAHDKPERRNVSMHPGPRHSRNFFGELVFSASMLFLLIPFPLVRFTLTANTCVACLQLAVLQRFLKFRFFVFHPVLRPLLLTELPYRNAPFLHCNLKGNDFTPLISNHQRLRFTIHAPCTRYKCFVTFIISRCATGRRSFRAHASPRFENMQRDTSIPEKIIQLTGSV